MLVVFDGPASTVKLAVEEQVPELAVTVYSPGANPDKSSKLDV